MEEKKGCITINCGCCGNNGGEATVPFIGENGNWWTGNEDTGIAARGPKGDKGDNAESLPFKKLYLLDGTIGDRDNVVPYPDDLCNSENLMPISLMVKSQDGIGYFNIASNDAYVWNNNKGIVILSASGAYKGRKCKCLLGRIE